MSPEMEQDIPLIEGPIAARRRALLLINPYSHRSAGSTVCWAAKPRTRIRGPISNL